MIIASQQFSSKTFCFFSLCRRRSVLVLFDWNLAVSLIIGIYHWKCDTSNVRCTLCRKHFIESFDVRYIEQPKHTSNLNSTLCQCNVESRSCNKVEWLNIEWAKLGCFWWVPIIVYEWAQLRFENWTTNFLNRGTIHQMIPYNSVWISNFQYYYPTSRTEELLQAERILLELL